MNWQPSASLTVIRQRARIYRQIRAFFNTRGCLEVDTPVLMPTTSTDLNVDSLEVPHNQRRLYLQTSPEYAMKRLLVVVRSSRFVTPFARARPAVGIIPNSACWNGTGLVTTTSS